MSVTVWAVLRDEGCPHCGNHYLTRLIGVYTSERVANEWALQNSKNYIRKGPLVGVVE